MKKLIEIITKHPFYIEEGNLGFHINDGENSYYLYLRKPLIMGFGIAWSGGPKVGTLNHAAEWFKQLFIEVNKTWLEEYKTKWLLQKKKDEELKELFKRIVGTEKNRLHEKAERLSDCHFSIENHQFIQHLAELLEDYQIPIEVKGNELWLVIKA